MAFVQIVEFRTSAGDELLALAHRYQQDTEGKRTVQGATMAVDRDDPSRYFVIARFESYESAMVNSNLPETQALAEKIGALAEGPPTFYDLDVIEILE